MTMMFLGVRSAVLINFMDYIQEGVMSALFIANLTAAKAAMLIMPIVTIFPMLMSTMVTLFLCLGVRPTHALWGPSQRRLRLPALYRPPFRPAYQCNRCQRHGQAVL